METYQENEGLGPNEVAIKLGVNVPAVTTPVVTIRKDSDDSSVLTIEMRFVPDVTNYDSSSPKEIPRDALYAVLKSMENIYEGHHLSLVYLGQGIQMNMMLKLDGKKDKSGT
jgi:hypothetical protein